MVSEDEWSVIKKLFEVDSEIVVTRTKSGPELLASDPPVCTECVCRRVEEEEKERLVYRGVPLFIRMVSGAEKLPNGGGQDPNDPDFENTNGGMVNGNGHAPDKKASSTPNGVSAAAAASAAPTPTPNGLLIRRSNRRQKVRGEKEILVSSDMKLQELKIKVRANT